MLRTLMDVDDPRRERLRSSARSRARRGRGFPVGLPPRGCFVHHLVRSMNRQAGAGHGQCA
jgi:hypothetical protein